MMAEKATNDSIEVFPATNASTQTSSSTFSTISSTVPSVPMTKIVGIAATARQEEPNGCLQSKMATIRKLTAKIAWQRTKRQAVDIKPDPTNQTPPTADDDDDKVTRMIPSTTTISRFKALEEPNLSPMPDDERLQHLSQRRSVPKDPMQDYVHQIHDLEMLLRMEEEDANHDAVNSIQGRISTLRRQLERAVLPDTENPPPPKYNTAVKWKDAEELQETNTIKRPTRDRIANELKLLHQILNDSRSKYHNLQQENRRLKDDLEILQNLVQRHDIVPSLEPWAQRQQEHSFHPELEAALENLAQVKIRNRELEEDLEKATEELTMFREQFYERAKATMAGTERTNTHAIPSLDQWTTSSKVKQGTVRSTSTDYAVQKEERFKVPPKFMGHDKPTSSNEWNMQGGAIRGQTTKHAVQKPESSESSSITLKTGNVQLTSDRAGLNYTQQHSQ